MSREDVLHRLIDAVTGRRNIGDHEADDLHDVVTPGYSAKPLSAEEQAQLDALKAKAALAAEKEAAAAAEKPAEPADEAGT